MKKNFLPLVTLLLFQISTSQIFATKGGFFVLDNGAPGKEYAGGGAVLIDWRDLEPVEGQYKWDLLTNPGATFVSWKQYYDQYLCTHGMKSCDEVNTSPQFAPAQLINQAHSAGKKMRFKIRVTEGALPLWLFGGEDKNGKVSSSYGTICAYKDYAWVPGQPECNSNTDIIVAITYPLYPLKEDNSEPVWWNPIFQEKFKKLIFEIGQKVQNDPVLLETIEFVEASVGSYGEMLLYGQQSTYNPDSADITLFKRAGYTNAKYVDSVYKILGFYIEAFPTTPIALSLGTGLYRGGEPHDDGSGVTQVEATVVPEVMRRWGSKLYLKFAGFGGGGSWYVGEIFRQYCPATTRCIYESYGGICFWNWNGYPFPFYNVKASPEGGDITTGIRNLKEIFDRGAGDKAYILMMWDADWRAINDARKHCGHLSDLTDQQNAQINQLEQAFSQSVPALWTLGAINPAPPPTSNITITLKRGWNSLNLTSSTIPQTCSKFTRRENSFWKPFLFEAGKKYSISCTSDVLL